MERIIVHTNWTNTISRRYAFALPDRLAPAKLEARGRCSRGRTAFARA
jgi:hypothetical protein